MNHVYFDHTTTNPERDGSDCSLSTGMVVSGAKSASLIVDWADIDSVEATCDDDCQDCD